jgi:pimeloyl-ACP methyl ester carboxylesterase
MGRTGSILANFVALLFAGAACAALAPNASDDSSLESYAKPGTLVSVGGGRKLNIRCLGTGSPTVILTAGAGDQSLAWRSLQTQLAQQTRVCAWDRAGFGFSDPSPAVQDTAHTTDDLEAVLAAPGTPAPYLLVGHSLGSYESLMFSFRHPEQVIGLVLIDPAAPHQQRRLKHAAPDTYAAVDGYQREQVAQLRSCIQTFAADCVFSPVKEYPPRLNQALDRLERNIDAKRNQLSLLEEAFTDEDSDELDGSRKTLGAIPMIVLTAGDPPPLPLQGPAATQMPQLQAEWSKMHDELAALSTRGVNRTVPGATHYIYVDRPQVVVKAVQEVLAASHAIRH